MKLQPLGDRVVVQVIEKPNQTEKGLYLPEASKEKPQTGKVIEVGPGLEGIPMTVKAGDTVLFQKFSGTEVALNTLQVLVMNESSILAIVK